jgi:hypothetical protein
MQINLTGRDLDLAVLNYEHPPRRKSEIEDLPEESHLLVTCTSYSKDWTLAGPLIEHCKITIYIDQDAEKVHLDPYIACTDLRLEEGWGGTDETGGEAAELVSNHSQRGATMLEAAMRCYLAIKEYKV